MTAPTYRVEFRRGTGLYRAHLCMEGCGFQHIITADIGGTPTAWGEVDPDYAIEWVEDALESSEPVTCYWVT